MSPREELAVSIGVLALFAALAIVGLIAWWVPVGIAAVRVVFLGYQAARG